MKLVQNVELNQKNVLLIADYNVSIMNEKLATTLKIDLTVQTINFILSKNPKSLFILTHLGRPKNKNEFDVKPITTYLQKHFPSIRFIPVEAYSCTETGLVFCDNSRYYSKDQLIKFYKNFDIIVNDAFGSVHRQLDCSAYAGFLIQKELEALERVKTCDLIIMGGAKAKNKKNFIENFEAKVFLGGLLALEGLKGKGYEVGTNPLHQALEELEIKKNVELPVDLLVKDQKGEYCVKKVENINKTDLCIDIGEESIENLKKLISEAKLIFWNGPLGNFENEKANSTKKLVTTLAECNAQVVVGGGETLLSVELFSSVKNFYHVSTGGGATLAYLGGEKLPGLESLE